ncbi:hypothetical protein [Flavisolibacter nicotianae]|uniref:hypothetical protein n=1 Tax=Flavisolibacter nicotianae TaxID=2364882 RepID=UPI000EAE616A|nr:hypothetical protein [Flavisolibacter nicotianae]
MKQILPFVMLMCFARNFSFSQTMNSFFPDSPAGIVVANPIYKLGIVGTIHNTGNIRSDAFLIYKAPFSPISKMRVVATRANDQLSFSSKMAKLILDQLGDEGMDPGALLHIIRNYGNISVDIKNCLYRSAVTVSPSTYNGKSFIISKGLNGKVLQGVVPESATAVKPFLNFFDGDIGVGTSDIDGYRLAVSDNAIFARVKVPPFDSWANIVLDKCDQWWNLREAEQYIRRDKHLHDVLSTSEIEKENLDVGTNQGHLLQKVEKLICCFSQQNKRIEKQMKIVANLSPKVSAQQKAIKKNARQIAQQQKTLV